MARRYYDLCSPHETDVNYRWLQPPQIAYLVSTVDCFGNANLTPATLGTLICTQYPRDGKPGSYYFAFSLGCCPMPDEGNELAPRHGFLNLEQNGGMRRQLFALRACCARAPSATCRCPTASANLRWPA